MKSNLILGAVVATAILSACNTKNEEEVVDTTPIVKIESVSREDVTQIQEFTATAEANVINNISSSMPLRISEIKVEVGDRVKKGDMLVKMDHADLIQAKIKLNNLHDDYKRDSALVAAGGASQQSLDSRKVQLDVAEAAFKQLQDNVTLKSPIGGVISARNFDNGDMSGASTILTVVDISTIKLKINVSESLYSKVKVGMPVDIAFDAFDGEVFKGKVSLIYPTIDPNTRTFTVEVNLQNSNYKVRPGMFARISINFGTENHVVVPDMAVIKQSGSGDRYVYVYNDGVVSYDKVELGQLIGDLYEVLSGVSDNAKVVVAGQGRLANGMEVKVDTASVIK